MILAGSGTSAKFCSLGPESQFIFFIFFFIYHNKTIKKKTSCSERKETGCGGRCGRGAISLHCRWVSSLVSISFRRTLERIEMFIAFLLKLPLCSMWGSAPCGAVGQRYWFSLFSIDSNQNRCRWSDFDVGCYTPRGVFHQRDANINANVRFTTGQWRKIKEKKTN